MLLGAEFERSRAIGGATYHRVVTGTEAWTGFYPQKHDAATKYLLRKGYGLNFNGELYKL